MRIAIFTAAVLVGLAACADTQGPLNPGFGDAYYHNMAVQVIEPQPVNAGSGAPDLEGERARIAIDRYRGATTLAPETMTTTEGGE
jgi:type IV pilus biogenesis protein CpaD/CtpE